MLQQSVGWSHTKAPMYQANQSKLSHLELSFLNRYSFLVTAGALAYLCVVGQG